MKASLKDKDFLKAVSILDVGDSIDVGNYSLLMEYKFSTPTHFIFHQRVFLAGVILKKSDSNTRIYIPAEKLNIQITESDIKKFDDKQIEDGKVLDPDRGVLRNKVI